MRTAALVSIVQTLLWLNLELGARAFMPTATWVSSSNSHTALSASHNNNNNNKKHESRTSVSPAALPLWKHAANLLSGIAVGGFLTASVTFAGPVWAENELSDRYGGGLDTSLVDQNCLIDQCSLQAKACLADDPNCRKGLTCTAKCLGDNACITGCMARYGTPQLDQFLKCTIEDHECIKIAILEGGADAYGQEPRAPAPTVAQFDPQSLKGRWYKVAGYNPNYDCYACQRNSFAATHQANELQMEVEFSMPHLLPDGSPPPPDNVQELIAFSGEESAAERGGGGAQSIGLNAYQTRETMVFDQVPTHSLTWNKPGSATEGQTFARTAHSEGEMFGLSKSLCDHAVKWHVLWTRTVSGSHTIFLVVAFCRILGKLVCLGRKRCRRSRIQVCLLQWQDASKYLRRCLCLQSHQGIGAGIHEEGLSNCQGGGYESRSILSNPQWVLCRGRFFDPLSAATTRILFEVSLSRHFGQYQGFGNFGCRTRGRARHDSTQCPNRPTIATAFVDIDNSVHRLLVVVVETGLVV